MTFQRKRIRSYGSAAAAHKPAAYLPSPEQRFAIGHAGEAPGLYYLPGVAPRHTLMGLFVEDVWPEPQSEAADFVFAWDPRPAPARPASRGVAGLAFVQALPVFLLGFFVAAAVSSTVAFHWSAWVWGIVGSLGLLAEVFMLAERSTRTRP